VRLAKLDGRSLTRMVEVLIERAAVEVIPKLLRPKR